MANYGGGGSGNGQQKKPQCTKPSFWEKTQHGAKEAMGRHATVVTSVPPVTAPVTSIPSLGGSIVYGVYKGATFKKC